MVVIVMLRLLVPSVMREKLVLPPVVKTVRKKTYSKVYVPNAHEIAKWPEWIFNLPPTDQNFLDWAARLRRAAEKVGDKLTNHAIGYLAETHDNADLRANWEKIRTMLGGDDYPLLPISEVTASRRRRAAK